MNWKKLGLVFTPGGEHDWDLHSALTPTPVVMHDKVRVYSGFRDSAGVSRIGYTDLDKKDPTKVIGVSEKPVLDIGAPGTFDDNGVILGDVFHDEDVLRMYYVGFQLVNKVKFLAFTGLATSSDGGETFQKVNAVPVLDRRENALFFNAIHSVIKVDGIYKCWMGAGSSWQVINGTQYPSYNVKYIDSEDGITFNRPSVDCISFSSPDEYRIGRPRVYFMDGYYHMIFTWGTKKGAYRMGYADSKNGIDWHRKDEVMNFHPSQDGWDNKWVSYGALFTANEQLYMVYNGNEMGKDGFGLALLNK